MDTSEKLFRCISNSATLSAEQQRIVLKTWRVGGNRVAGVGYRPMGSRRWRITTMCFVGSLISNARTTMEEEPVESSFRRVE
jgi:hypothetical protein